MVIVKVHQPKSLANVCSVACSSTCEAVFFQFTLRSGNRLVARCDRRCSLSKRWESGEKVQAKSSCRCWLGVSEALHALLGEFCDQRAYLFACLVLALALTRPVYEQVGENLTTMLGV